MLRYPKVLVLSSDEAETAALEQVLCLHMDFTTVKTLPELVSRLDVGDYDALLCAWWFCMGAWNDALREVQNRQPDLPVLILGRTPDETDWMKVLDAGAFDLLVPPYREQPLLAMLEQAASSREGSAWRALHRQAV